MGFLAQGPGADGKQLGTDCRRCRPVITPSSLPATSALWSVLRIHLLSEPQRDVWVRVVVVLVAITLLQVAVGLLNRKAEFLLHLDCSRAISFLSTQLCSA